MAAWSCTSGFIETTTRKKEKARVMCLNQAIKSNTHLPPNTDSGIAPAPVCLPAKPLWILIEKMACVSYYGKHVFDISAPVLCHYLLKGLPVYMLILSERRVPSIEMLCAAREDPNICLFWSVHARLRWAENKKIHNLLMQSKIRQFDNTVNRLMASARSL